MNRKTEYILGLLCFNQFLREWFFGDQRKGISIYELALRLRNLRNRVLTGTVH